MNKKKIIITICIFGLISLVILGISNFISSNNDKAEKELREVKELKIKLEARKSEVFIADGFTEEYYRINEELKDVNQKIQKNEITSGPPLIFFTIFGLTFIIILGTAVITIFRTIIMHKTITKTATTIVNDHTKEKNTDDTEKIVSILSKVAADMAINMNPEYKSLNCPNCGANLKNDVEVCEYCDTPLIKVAAKRK